MSDLHAEILALIQAVRHETIHDKRRDAHGLCGCDWLARFEAELGRRWVASLERAALVNEGDVTGMSLAVNPVELDRIERDARGLDRPMTVGLWTFVYSQFDKHEKSVPGSLIGHCSIGWIRRWQGRLEAALAAAREAPHA